MDPWYGLGGADMLDVAHMAVHAVPMTSREAIAWSFDAVTEIPARVMGLEGYGLEVGAYADMVRAAGRRPDRGGAAARRAAGGRAARPGDRAHAGAAHRARAGRPAGDARPRGLRAGAGVARV